MTSVPPVTGSPDLKPAGSPAASSFPSPHSRVRSSTSPSGIISVSGSISALKLTAENKRSSVTAGVLDRPISLAQSVIDEDNRNHAASISQGSGGGKRGSLVGSPPSNPSNMNEIKDVIEHHNRIVAARSAGDDPSPLDRAHEIVPQPHRSTAVEEPKPVFEHSLSLKDRSVKMMSKLTNVYHPPAGISESSEPLQARIRDQLVGHHSPSAATTAKIQSVPLFSEEALNFPTKDWIYSMRFPNTALEHHFNACYYSKAVLMVRLTVFVIFLVNCFAGVTDLAVYNSSQRENIWIIRYSAITPACLIYLGLTRHSIFFSYRQLATAIFCVFVATMLMWISAIGAQPNHGIYMIILNVYSLFLGFHYIVSTVVNFVVFIIFIGWNYSVTVLRGAQDGSVESETAYSNSHQWLLSFAYILLTALMLVVVGYFIESSFRGAFLQMQRLRCEQHKTNIVLYNILPKNIAMNLVRGIRSADYYHSASVLFCDICDFKYITSGAPATDTSPPSSPLSASELIGLLNLIYSTFDRITDQHDVLKIETIGEVYMVASGLPEETDNHAESLLYLALDMQLIADNFYTLYNTQTHALHFRSKRIEREQLTGRRITSEKENIEKVPVKFRIGIHSGDVIAGVIGVKLPRYRLFGDSINTASRMQSTCLPAKIQVSSATYDLAKETFLFEDRGEIPVKGKGMMRTYFLIGKNNSYEHRMSSLKSIDGFAVLRDSSEAARNSARGSQSNENSASGNFLTQMIVRKSLKGKRTAEPAPQPIQPMKPIEEINDDDEDDDEAEAEKDHAASNDAGSNEEKNNSAAPSDQTTGLGMIAIIQRGSTRNLHAAESDESQQATQPSTHQRTRTAAEFVSIAIGAFKSGLNEKPKFDPVAQQEMTNLADLQPGSHRSLKKAAISVMKLRSQTSGLLKLPNQREEAKSLDVAVDSSWEAHNAEVMMRTLRRKGSIKKINGNESQNGESKPVKQFPQPNLYLTTGPMGSISKQSVGSRTSVVLSSKQSQPPLSP